MESIRRPTSTHSDVSPAASTNVTHRDAPAGTGLGGGGGLGTQARAISCTTFALHFGRHSVLSLSSLALEHMDPGIGWIGSSEHALAASVTMQPSPEAAFPVHATQSGSGETIGALVHAEAILPNGQFIVLVIGNEFAQDEQIRGSGGIGS